MRRYWLGAGVQLKDGQEILLLLHKSLRSSPFRNSSNFSLG
jgi:hypothetical protein